MIKYLFIILALSLLNSPVLFAQSDNNHLFTFGVISDVQYCDCDVAGTRHYRSSPQKLSAAIDTFNKHNVQFVISLGDFIDRGFGSYDTLNTIMKRLNSPVYHVTGNHDFSVAPHELKKVPGRLGLTKTYYTFRKSGWRFIALDGNEVSLHATADNEKKLKEAREVLQELKSRKSLNAQQWNGGISKKQFSWLKRELIAAGKANEKVIVLCHFPVSPDGGMYNLWNYIEIKALIRQYPNVFAYFNGHDHKGGYAKEQGIHHVTFKGMVEKDENAFSIVDAYTDHLAVSGRGSQNNFILK